MKTRITVLIIGMIALTGCKKETISCWEASTYETERLEEIQFNASCSYEAYSYDWDFGDGETSFLENPSHSYTEPGNYTVSLKTTGKKGKTTDITTRNITILDNDLCAGVTCYNGGTCVNGNCDCPPGYSGSDCATVLTPTAMKINKITVTSYPTTSGGSLWDPSSNADVYISINSGTTANNTDFITGYYSDVTGGSLTYQTDFPATINTPGNNWTFSIWDYDTVDADDFMTGFYFKPNSKASGFPSTFTVSTTSLTMVFYVEWVF